MAGRSVDQADKHRDESRATSADVKKTTVAAGGRRTRGESPKPAGVTRRRGRGGGPATITVASAAEASYAADGPVARVVDALGNNTVADLLQVSRSQPSRWRSGKERPSPDSRRRISDLDHVLDRLLLELYPDQAGLWLTGANPHLGGARPVDVLELRGAVAVLPAIDALAAGAFA